MTDPIDWHAEAAKAQAAIAEVGAPTTITGPSIGQSGYDPDTDTYHAVSQRSVEAFAVLATQTITDDNGRLTRAQIATLTAPAMTGDTVTIGELQYRVAKSLTIAPGGVPLLWSAILET